MTSWLCSRRVIATWLSSSELTRTEKGRRPANLLLAKALLEKQREVIPSFDDIVKEDVMRSHDLHRSG